MNFKRLAQHDIKNIIREQKIESFTKESLITSFSKASLYKPAYMLSLYNIENLLQELVAEGYLVATYSSITIDNNLYNSYNRQCNKYCYTGSKSIATYKLN